MELFELSREGGCGRDCRQVISLEKTWMRMDNQNPYCRVRGGLTTSTQIAFVEHGGQRGITRETVWDTGCRIEHRGRCGSGAGGRCGIHKSVGNRRPEHSQKEGQKKGRRRRDWELEVPVLLT